ncbi:hypothetical protein FTX61_20060 [Nitriliruptoraceae bacterium ZYF776]|nr:hypothetical protein [Profundirhabdus halotolerans]
MEPRHGHASPSRSRQRVTVTSPGPAATPGRHRERLTSPGATPRWIRGGRARDRAGPVTRGRSLVSRRPAPGGPTRRRHAAGRSRR